MSYLKYGYVFLCIIFLVGLPLTSWSQDAVPEGEPTLELAEGESENVSTEEAYEVEDQSPEELDHEAQQILDLKQAVAAAANAGHNGWKLTGSYRKTCRLSGRSLYDFSLLPGCHLPAFV